jgi:hypothetical protein
MSSADGLVRGPIRGAGVPIFLSAVSRGLEKDSRAFRIPGNVLALMMGRLPGRWGLGLWGTRGTAGRL